MCCGQHLCLFGMLLNLKCLIYFQVEVTNRLDFIWRRQCQHETEEVKMTGSLNKMLLENILPVHVADYFMGGNKQSVSTVKYLYHAMFRAHRNGLC